MDIFFVISGFVIYLTGRKLGAAEFFRRRLIRVGPLYWIFLTLKLTFTKLSGAAGLAQLGTTAYLLASFAFIPGYRANGFPVPPITAAWTLDYEMYFYVGFAALLAVGCTRLLTASTLWIGFATLAGVWLWHGGDGHPPAMAMLLAPICLEFLAGMWLAEGWIRGVSLPFWASVVLAGIAVTWLALMPEPLAFEQERILKWGLPAILLIIAAINSERSFNFAKWRPGLILGDASYAIYLSHTIVLPFADKVVAKAHLPWMAAVLTEATLAMLVGLVVHIMLEKPLTGWLARRTAFA